VYGSLTQAGRFAEWSDVDLALEEEPEGRSIYLLMSLLSERVGREVDVALLGETRLREKIVKEGERWIA
jgi:predicted nucleotidyltransferase